MYGLIKEPLLRLVKAPLEPPEPPAGDHETLRIFRASPRYLTYRMLGLMIVGSLIVLPAFAAWAAALAQGETVTIGSVAAFTLLALCGFFLGYFLIRIDYDMRYYLVTDRSIRIREGAWTIKEMTLTHANVQNLRVSQGPLQRLFGIANLELDTAGGGGAAAQQGQQVTHAHAAQMAGIENAHEVRDLVLAHLRRNAAGSGLGDPDDEPAALPATQPAAGASSPSLLEALEAVRDAAAALRAEAER
ncbi:MAG: PH domain-containing protein [Deltaproteobacteria bacterium]|nr:PH domain-containing protein [Deltaproteobacteria bacterium]